MKTYGNARNKLAIGLVWAIMVSFITACATPEVSSETPIAAVTASITSTTPTITPALVSTGTLPLTTARPTLVSPIATPTLAPSVMPTAPSTPPPTPTNLPMAAIQVYETTVTLPTYPFRDFLVEQIDPVYNIPVYYFNRADYEATPHQPAEVTYNGIVLENPYLRLTFLPELGGRLYSAYVKSTGQELFYHNPVVKPSRYGVLQPYEANWWLATGGMEWAYPTQEHGYRFGVAWDYQVTQTATSATITLSDTAPDRVGLTVDVTLPANTASFVVEPTLINNGPATAPIQLWTNAALTLGANTMSLETQFTMPGDSLTVHSRGESGWTMPGERQSAPWPQVGDTDLRYYNQWANYLGFFVPNRVAPFFGAYNPETDLGVVRLSDATPGTNKLFAFGQDFPDRSYTDDNSQYFEIWGGLNAGFWSEDDIPVAVGQTLGWQETWWPLAQLGGLTWATEQIAIHTAPEGEAQILTALVSQHIQGSLQVMANQNIVLTESFSATPTTPNQWRIPAGNTPLTIQFFDAGGNTLLNYSD